MVTKKKYYKKKILHKNTTLKIFWPYIKTINNYKVLFIKSNSRLLSIQSYIFNGFIHESKENLGINHLLEHVLVNSYKKCKKFDCFKYLNQMGINYNAYTTNNILNYYTVGLNKDIDKMLDYIVKITVKPIFNNALINREKQAVYNELLALIDNSTYNIQNRLSKLLYTYYGLKCSNDAEQQILNLKKFNHKNLQEYYQKNYTNDNILFVISGKFNEIDIINKFKSKLPIIQKNEKVSCYRNMNCFTNIKTTEFLKNDKLRGTQISLCFPTKIKYNSKKLIILKLTRDLLKYYLFQTLRTKHRLVYSINLNIDINICSATINLFINTKNENLLKVLTLLKQTINYYKKNIINKSDIDSFKKMFMIKHFNKNYTSKYLADFYGIQYIYQYFLGTKILYPDKIKNIYMMITGKDIQECICENFNFKKLICLYSNNNCAVDFEF